MRTTPLISESGAVSYTLKVNGAVLQEDVRTIVVQQVLNRIPAATLVFGDGNVAAQDFPVSSLPELAPGNTIEIFLGLVSEESLLFKGVIVKQHIAVYRGGSHLEVHCRDAAYEMTLQRNSRYFENQSDSDIAEQLLDEYGFQHDVAATAYKHPELVQYDVSDWDFLMLRAEANGLLTMVDQGKFRIGPPDFEQDPILTVRFGGNDAAGLLEFEGELELRDQFKTVRTEGWDTLNQEPLQIEAEEPSIKSNGDLAGPDLADKQGVEARVLRHGGKAVDDERQAWANAALLKDRLARTRGRIRIHGCKGICPGDLIKLDGFGRRLNGPVFVAGIRQEYGDNGWTTDIEFGLPPQWFAQSVRVEAPLAAGLLAGVHGLQVATVTQIEDDPGGEHRIRIRMPAVDNKAPGAWARLATLDAGNKRGAFFLPEPGDEVIAGFINDDPRDAVVLGMLHSRKNAAPFKAAKNNPEKGFVSREQLKLLFQEEDKSITLETPGGNKIILSDQNGGLQLTDQHGNSITLDSKGITLKSGQNKDVIIEAQKDLKAKATMNLELQANINAQLKANAMTEIKGNLVNIN